MAEITELLLQMRAGNPQVLDELFPLVYEELRRIAHHQLVGERVGHTIGTTGLVHEAYLRLVDQTHVAAADRRHFYRLAARAMRQVLVDYARRHRAQKRGAGVVPLALDDATTVAAERAENLVALDEALGRLQALDPRLGQVVECRFFGGLSEAETATALEVTARTVRRDWVKARGWLSRELEA